MILPPNLLQTFHTVGRLIIEQVSKVEINIGAVFRVVDSQWVRIKDSIGAHL